jgi:hypothetical protein
VPTLLLSLLLLQSDETLLKDLQALTPLAPTDERTLRAMVEQTLPRVAKVMHARAPKNPTVKIVSRAAAAGKLKAVLAREYPGDRLDRLGAALKAVRLIEPGVDLQREALELYATNVGGFYDPHDRTLYLLADQPALMQQLAIAHELAHAIQDEQLGLERLTREAMRSEDAQLALSAALEGNAQAVAAEVVGADSGDEDGMAGALIAESTALSASLAAQASGVNPWLALQLSFPYEAGGELVRAVATKDDPAACRLLSRLPASTAQVLDPAIYRNNQAPLRGSIGLAFLLPGTERVYETTLGRANIDLLARSHDAGRLAEGWRGDVFELVKKGAMQSAAWAIAFKEARQAEAFATFYSKLLGAKDRVDGAAVEDKEGSISGVIVRGSAVLILIRVPVERWNPVVNGWDVFGAATISAPDEARRSEALRR